MAGVLGNAAAHQRSRILETARKIVATAATAQAIAVMPAGQAPVVTIGGNQVRSTVAVDPANPAQGASVYTPTLPFTDRTKFAPRSAVMSSTGFPSWVDRGAPGVVSLGRTNGHGYGYDLYSNCFDISIEATAGGVHRLQVKVDGQWIGANDITVTANGQVVYVKLTWASWATRRVEFYTTNSSNIRGINIPPGATIRAAPVVGAVRGLFLSDSFGEITGTDRNRNVLPFKMAEGLGWDGLITSPSSGTGWVARAPAKNMFERRQDMTRVGELDWLGFWFYINDRAQDPAEVRNNVAATLACARELQPNAMIQVFGAGNSALYKTPAAIEQAVLDGYNRSADWRTRYSRTSQLITGTGYQGAPNGTGNSDNYIFTDGLHPSAAGHAYFAAYAAGEVLAHSRALLAAA